MLNKSNTCCNRSVSSMRAGSEFALPPVLKNRNGTRGTEGSKCKTAPESPSDAFTAPLHIFSIMLSLFILLLTSINLNAEEPAKIPDNAPYKNKSLPPEVRAENVVSLMTLDEKKHFVAGYQHFFTYPLKRFGLRSVYMTDATAGVHIRRNLDKSETESIAYPCTVEMTATWDKELAWKYGNSVGRECRQLGTDIQLGPSFNLYRTSTCGRNFEYMGEDPFLVSSIVTEYIKGLQHEKVIATPKHFICNNHEWLRHNSDSIVSERALHEIYMYPWYRVMKETEPGAVMCSYNFLNGEKVSQSRRVLTGLLRNELGFKGFIMSDWGAVWKPDQAMLAGLDLIMPRAKLEQTKLSTEQKTEECLNRMVKNILTQLFKFGIYDRDRKDPASLSTQGRKECENIALQTAREGITLLKNNGILPIDPKSKANILMLGPGVKNIMYAGGGSGNVKGYDIKQIFTEFKRLMPNTALSAPDDWKNIDDTTIKQADTVILCVDQHQKEGWDQKPFLDKQQEALVSRCTALNKNSVVIVCSGSALNMKWANSAAAILWAFYPGQYGATAIAEIATGKINPSGKLPYTIERSFSDSPAAGYIPEGATWFQSKYKSNPIDQKLPDNPKVYYIEGVFAGYRWYDARHTKVAFPFGHGLHYTTFKYSNLKTSVDEKGIHITVNIENTGKRAGDETVQLYIGAPSNVVPRPPRELKGFRRVTLKPGDSTELKFTIPPNRLSYYDVKTKKWKIDPGMFNIEVGASSRDIRCVRKIWWNKELQFTSPF